MQNQLFLCCIERALKKLFHSLLVLVLKWVKLIMGRAIVNVSPTESVCFKTKKQWLQAMVLSGLIPESSSFPNLPVFSRFSESMWQTKLEFLASVVDGVVVFGRGFGWGFELFCVWRVAVGAYYGHHLLKLEPVSITKQPSLSTRKRVLTEPYCFSP